MKILHITNNLWSGGVTTFLISLLNYLSLDNEITLLLLGQDDEPYLKEKFNKNIKIIFLNQEKLYSIKNIFKIREHIKKNEVIHTHLFPALYLGVLSNLVLNKKLITTEHAAYNNRRKYFFFKWIDRWIYSKYSLIIPCSYGAEKTLVEWLGEGYRKKTMVILNGIDLKKYESIKEKRKELFSFDKNDKLVCMIARFSKQKDQKTLLRAMKLLPNNIKCIFVGIGEELENIKKYTEDLGLDNKRVIFLGYRNDVPEILKSCDLSILSSYYEGLPMVALESLAIGTLMIGSRIEGLKEILKEEMLLFEVENEKELANKVQKLLYDDREIKKIKIKISSEIKKYSIVEMLKKYKVLYENIKEE